MAGTQVFTPIKIRVITGAIAAALLALVLISGPAPSFADEPEEEAPYSVTPKVTIGGVPETINGLDPLDVTFTFSEDVTGFEAADITVDNGSLKDLTGSGAEYSATVTPTGPGDLSVTVAAQSVQAAQGENNAAGPPEAETATARLITKPKFAKGPSGITRAVEEDIAAGARVGGTVAARDPDGDALTYSLSGSDLFDIDPATGGISVAAGAVLDYETAQSHTVTVGVTDGEDDDGNPETEPAIDDTVEVVITVYDVHEPPAKPDKPLVAPSSGDPAASLEVSWTAPDNSGQPPITDYQVRHRKNGDKYKDDWTEQTVTGTATAATITGLDPDTKYRVQVAVTNDEGTGPWSEPGTKRTADWTISIEEPEGPRTTGDAFEVRVIIPQVGVVDPVAVAYDATNAPLPQQTCAFRSDGGDYRVCFRVTPEHENRPGSWPFEVRFTAGYEGREVSWPVTVDPDPPVVTISGPSEPQSGPFEVRFSLSEKNAGFEESDVTVANGSVTAFSGSERSYTAQIAPESSGQVTVAVPAGALQDGVGHRNKATQHSVTADLGEPTVSIEGVPATISNVAPLEVTFTFSEDVTGFYGPDVTVVNGSLEDWDGSGADDSATVTPDGGGDLTVTVSTRAAQGKNNVAGPLEAETATAVLTGPATFIAGPKGPLTTEDPFDIRITYLGLSDGATFGESILNATLSGDIFPGDDGVREVTVTPDPPGPTGIRQGATGRYNVSVVSSWDKGNERFIGEYVVEVDPDPPVVIISGPEEPQDGPFQLTIDFSEPVSQLFEEDVAVTNGTVASFERTKDEMRPDRYTLTIAPTAVGQVTLAVPAGAVQDGVEHPNEAAQHSVTVNPAKPDAPKVQRSDSDPNTKLDVSWAPPSNAGDAVTDYDLQYRVEGEEEWTDHAFDSAETRTTISGKRATVYEVRVRAAVGENSPAGTAVGDPVKITDPDGDLLTYSLDFLPGHENDADSFDINPATGQISVAEGVRHGDLDYEVQSEYVMRVLAHDGISNLQDRASAPLTITVTDTQPPGRPTAPTVVQGANPATGLEISWTATGADGVAPITDYDVHYRVEGAEDWTRHDFDGAVPGTTIGGLEPGAVYEVQVLARNPEGDSPWSESGTGVTGPAKLNAQREVREDARPGDPVGEPVTVDDPQGHTLIYSIVTDEYAESGFARSQSNPGHGHSEFTIDPATGQITVAPGAKLDYETAHRHTLTVQARHAAPGHPDDHIIYAIISVVIDVTDVEEPSDGPSPRNPDGGGNPDGGSGGGNPGGGSGGDNPGGGSDGDNPGGGSGGGNPGGGSGGGSPGGGGGNNSPSFGPGSGNAREIAENAAAGSRVSGPVTATDPDGDSLTYLLWGSGAFDIDPATGQIIVSGALDYEATSRYQVAVTGRGGDGNADSAIDDYINLVINVIDVDEPPAKTGAPSVTPASATPETALDVTWTAPANTGPVITDYDVRYRVRGSGDGFTDAGYDGTATTTAISGLDPGAVYEVQIAATNDEDTGDWSDPGTGSTNAVREVAENSPAGTLVGTPVTIEAPAGDTVTYTLGNGGDAGFFDIDSVTGQITLTELADLDYETKSVHRVTVVGNDGATTKSFEVTINITDVDEPPARPGAPTVEPASGGSDNPDTSLDVTWTAPANTGPAITGYDVRYRKQGEPEWTEHAFTGTGAATAIEDLDSETTYEVQIAAANDEGASGWSEPGTGGSPFPQPTEPIPSGPDDPEGHNDPEEPGNSEEPGVPEGPGNPNETDNPDGAPPTVTTPNGPSGFPRTGGSNDSLIREVAESAPAGSPVGKLITALDPENDPLTYSLTGSDTFDPPRRIFDIDPATGQIFVVGEGLDYETVQSYTVTLMVTDGKGANGAPDPAIDDTVEVVINVTDVDEPPARLGAPTVAPSSTDPNTALEVTWTAPANTGPAVTDYRVRYRKQGGGAWSEPIFTGTATAAAIGGLEPGGTYEVQVAADNDEGASPWSNSETSSTFPDTAAKIDPSGLDHRGGANEGGEADGGDSPDHNSDFSDRDGRNGPGNAYGQQVSRLDSGAYLPAYSPTESTAVFRSVVGRVSLEQQSTALLVSLRARWRVPTNRGPPVSNKGPPAG